MKLFLKKLAFYVVVPITVCQIFLLIAHHFISMRVHEQLGDIARNNSVLIMGDSQMQKIAPEFIDGNTYNLASAGEHYFFTYSKLRKLIAAEDHKIRLIILGVSVHNFGPLFLNHFDLTLPEGKGSLQRYLFFFDPFDNDFSQPLDVILNKEFFLGVLQGPEWGGHDVLFSKNPEVPFIKGRLKYLYEGRVVHQEVSAMQEVYLDKIVELCRKENISLVLVSTPGHQYYKAHVDPVYYESLQKVVTKNSNLLHLNFLSDSTSSAYMSDANHLNKEGAEVYSKKINLGIKNLSVDGNVIPSTEN